MISPPLLQRYVVCCPFSIVEKYSPGVREKPAVRFAVEAALALDSNNFVKFFKLVKLVFLLSLCVYCLSNHQDANFQFYYCLYILVLGALLFWMRASCMGTSRWWGLVPCGPWTGHTVSQKSPSASLSLSWQECWPSRIQEKWVNKVIETVKMLTIHPFLLEFTTP